jgi:hypothetical protein
MSERREKTVIVATMTLRRPEANRAKRGETGESKLEEEEEKESSSMSGLREPSSPCLAMVLSSLEMGPARLFYGERCNGYLIHRPNILSKHPVKFD